MGPKSKIVILKNRKYDKTQAKWGYFRDGRISEKTAFNENREKIGPKMGPKSKLVILKKSERYQNTGNIVVFSGWGNYENRAFNENRGNRHQTVFIILPKSFLRFCLPKACGSSCFAGGCLGRRGRPNGNANSSKRRATEGSD